MLNKIINSDGFNAIVRGRYGYVIFNKNDTIIGKSVENYGEFSEAEVNLFRQICSKNDIVIEIGANIGTHTIALSKFIGEKGRIYAFEPQRIVFQTLCANISINSITNVECFQAVVSSETGYALIPEIRYDIKRNFGAIEVDKFGTGTKVPKIKLDNFFESSALKLLKIDVEGMEYDVILGARYTINKYKPLIYVENDRPHKSKKLIELLWFLGYRIFWHLPYLFNPDNYATNPENIYSINSVSINMLCVHKSFNKSFNFDFLETDEFDEVKDSSFHPLWKSYRRL